MDTARGACVIDGDGFRPNVGIVVANAAGQVLWARRVGGKDAWQFPQGGMNKGESAEDCMYRELYEEVGLEASDVDIQGQTQGWLRYKLPQSMRRSNSHSRFKGQKQKWFLLELIGSQDKIRFDCADKAEFDHYTWVSYWYPVDQVIDFKRDVYRRALLQLAPRLKIDSSARAIASEIDTPATTDGLQGE